MFRSSSDTNDRYGWRCCGWRCCADAISILTSHHCNVFPRMCASIGFQKLVVTYWPSSWFRPWSLCGRLLKLDFQCSSTRPLIHPSVYLEFLLIFFFSLQRLALKELKVLVPKMWNDELPSFSESIYSEVVSMTEIPVRSHFLSTIDFWCCWILVLVFIEVSPTSGHVNTRLA